MNIFIIKLAHSKFYWTKW